MCQQRFLMLAAISPILWCGTAWASSEGGKGSIMSIHWGLAFWTVVTFLVLLLVLKHFAWKPLLASLDTREKAFATPSSRRRNPGRMRKNCCKKPRKI